MTTSNTILVEIINDHPELAFEIIKKKPDLFCSLRKEHQTKKINLIAVSKRGDNLQYIKEPEEKLVLNALRNDGTAIRFIENPSEKLCQVAVKNDGLAISWIKNPSKETQLLAIEQNPWSIKQIEDSFF